MVQRVLKHQPRILPCWMKVRTASLLIAAFELLLLLVVLAERVYRFIRPDDVDKVVKNNEIRITNGVIQTDEVEKWIGCVQIIINLMQLIFLVLHIYGVLAFECVLLLPHLITQVFGSLYLLGQSLIVSLRWGLQFFTISHLVLYLLYVAFSCYLTYVNVVCYRYIKWKQDKRRRNAVHVETGERARY